MTSLTRSKLLTWAAATLLLGIGLCGVGVLIPPMRTQEVSINLASLLGFILCDVSVLLLIVTLLWYLVTHLVSQFRDKR